MKLTPQDHDILISRLQHSFGISGPVLASSYYRFKLVIGGRDRHVLDDSGGVVWTLLPIYITAPNQSVSALSHPTHLPRQLVYPRALF